MLYITYWHEVIHKLRYYSISKRWILHSFLGRLFLVCWLESSPLIRRVHSWLAGDCLSAIICGGVHNLHFPHVRQIWYNTTQQNPEASSRASILPWMGKLKTSYYNGLSCSWNLALYNKERYWTVCSCRTYVLCASLFCCLQGWKCWSCFGVHAF